MLDKYKLRAFARIDHDIIAHLFSVFKCKNLQKHKKTKKFTTLTQYAAQTRSDTHIPDENISH